ncbi:MAG: hypothetical protein U1F68_08625 [Gammaproteobacteria bacterium]
MREQRRQQRLPEPALFSTRQGKSSASGKGSDHEAKDALHWHDHPRFVAQQRAHLASAQAARVSILIDRTARRDLAGMQQYQTVAKRAAVVKS